nr:MAG TPA: hypothetical protein [Caudoviricetes sp.]
MTVSNTLLELQEVLDGVRQNRLTNKKRRNTE